MHHILLVFLTALFMMSWFSGRAAWWGLILVGGAILLYVFMPRWDRH